MSDLASVHVVIISGLGLLCSFLLCVHFLPLRSRATGLTWLYEFIRLARLNLATFFPEMVRSAANRLLRGLTVPFCI
jgi:hypothetical protein